MNSKNSSEHCKLVVVKQDRVLTDAIYLISHIDGTTRMHQLSIS
ncbi:unnamed protein product, partial [Anisakis simplex]|uniref:Transcriptional regulator n=1 Tax=Anisakis simplex TaxID=6269 RepID=A0A0M3JQQ1_ANISI